MPDIRFEETCGACPEQYNAYLGDTQVGYLRVRHGHFRVHFGNSSGEVLYQSPTKGDGLFAPDERDHFLAIAEAVIRRKLARKTA